MVRLSHVLTIWLLLWLSPSVLAQQPDSQVNRSQAIQRLTEKPVSFLSDTDAAYEYLETIQKLAFARDPKAFRWTNDEKQKQTLLTLLSDLDRMETEAAGSTAENSYSSLYNNLIAVLNRPVPTHYEEPNSLAILEGIIKQLENTTGSTVPRSVKPRFGTLPTGTLNARTVLVPDSLLRLVVINSALFPFCYEYLKIGLKTVTFRNDSDNLIMDYSDQTFERDARRNKDIIVRLSKLFEDVANLRSVRGQERPSAPEVPLLLRMVNAMEFFFVAHEYGHIALGHLSNQKDIIQLPGLNNQGLTVLRRSWGQEGAADVYAFSLLDKYLSSEEAKNDVRHAGVDLRQFLRLAPLFFFVFSSDADEMQYIFTHKTAPRALTDDDKRTVISYLQSALSGKTKSPGGSVGKEQSTRGYNKAVMETLKSDHPPAFARLALMQRYLQDHSGPKANPTDLAFRDLGLAVLAHIQVMESDLKPIWISIIQRN
jgi:hypothetical protein